MEEKQKKRFYLKWPWDLVVYAALLVLFRLWAVPVILLLAFWNKKQRPDVPEEGYCLQRTRQRLTRLALAALFLLLGGLMAFYFVGCIVMENRAAWQTRNYAIWGVSGAAALAFLIAGFVEAYHDLRDAFCPAKSALAQSIRNQLPYPEEAPSVKELFAMVDQDIRENGQWFDRVAVGKRWVLGDAVNDLSRIRVMCGRDETIHRHHGGRTQTSRVIELYLLDDRRRLQVSALRNARELPMLMECLRLRAPEAIVCSYQELSAYTSQTDEEWESLEREYRQRSGQRAGRQDRRESGNSRSFVLINGKGQRTSRVDMDQVEEQLGLLTEYGAHFGVDLLEPVEMAGQGMLTHMGAGLLEEGLVLTAVLRQDDGTYRGFGQPVSAQEARAVFERLLGGQLPDLSGWQPLRAVEEESEQQRPRAKLTIRDAGGSTRSYTSFTRRDLELAGEGLSNGKYRQIVVMAGAFYIQLTAGDQTDGRVTVCASRPGPDELELFETKCSDRQARQWLLDFGDGRFSSDFKDWKNITKQVQASIRRSGRA